MQQKKAQDDPRKSTKERIREVLPEEWIDEDPHPVIL